MRAWTGPVAAIYLLTNGGCTLLGGGIGLGVSAATPGPYAIVGRSDEGFDRKTFRQRVNVQLEDQVLIERIGQPSVEGEYMGLAPDRDPGPGHPSYLLIAVEGKTQRILLSDVRGVEVEQLGNGWLAGLGAGLLIDLVLGAIVAESYDASL